MRDVPISLTVTEVESVLSSDVEARVDAVTQSDVLADDIQERIEARIARIEQAIEMVSAELANRSSCTIIRVPSLLRYRPTCLMTSL